MFANFTILIVTIILIPFIVLTIIGIVIYKNRHKIGKTLDDISSDIEKHIKTASDSISPTTTCQYCKTKYSKKLSNCPNCGAKKE